MSNESAVPLATIPIFEVVLYIALLLSMSSAWRTHTADPASLDADERALGATVIMGQLNAVITGSSIIVAGIAAFVALENATIDVPENYHLIYATGWAVLALGFSLYGHGVLPAQTPKHNFVNLGGVAFLCASALYFCLAAGVRFLFAVWNILF